MCLAERNWLKSNDRIRNELKDIFVRVRKVFDREVQLTNWRYQKIPFGVNTDDSSISMDSKIILRK